MYYGWTGRRLVVNLTDRRTRIEEIPQKYLEQYVGGRGLNSRTLYDYQKPGIDPLGPENPLIFGVGPMTGTALPASGRYTATAFSPLTVVGNDDPCFGDANGGGHWGQDLKYCGFDQLIIEGASETPVYLVIRDDQVDIRDASHLWGKDTSQTEELIYHDLRDPKFTIACIGPAGENLVRIAAIINNRQRAAAKCGMGAVMGSKKLKAIALKGSHGVPVKDVKYMQRVLAEAMEALADDPSARVYSRQGTPSLVRAHSKQGRTPTRNYQETVFPNFEALTAESFEKDYWTRTKGCFGCPMHCSHWFEVKEGAYAGISGEGPEYVSVGAFGTKVGVDQPDAVLAAHRLCNLYGIDVLNAGGTLGWAMECWQRGALNEAETGGLNLDWGNDAAVMEMLTRMAYRSDALGDLIAEGAYRAAKRLGRGSQRWVAHAKGQDPALSDARAAKAWGLAYATASRGGCHLRALPSTETFFTPQQAREMFGTDEAVAPRGVKGKGRLVRWSEDQRAVADSLETCKFIVRTNLVWPEWEAKFFNAATGANWTGEDVMLAGERITNIERAINVRQGLTRKDDRLSERMMNDPIPSGPSAGETLNLDPMLDEYYEARGWNLLTGWQTRETLERLGMPEIAADLDAAGKLG
ncbi:MAG TPA: aldehyde ferredoxin oxidoreductase family protein [Symbiobacteriaceae bacterium]|nr:aldehyde ferredoxin oxidoreductase family protein [Symbiobacteriaceae bacterium]